MSRSLTYTLCLLLGLLGVSAAQAQEAPDFTVTLTVSDQAKNSRTLTLGMAPDASDDFTDPTEIEIPPPPPAGAFHAALRVPFVGDYENDIRETPAPGGTADFQVYYQPSVDQSGATPQPNTPVELSWDPAAFPSTVQATILDIPTEGNIVSQPLDGLSSYTVTESALSDGLLIRMEVFGPPSAPSGLSGTASATSIDLSWTDTADDEDNFVLERSTDGGTSFTTLATPGANSEAYTDSGLSPSTEYCYRVAAENGIGASAFSNEACITTPAANLAFTPTGLTFSLAEGGNSSQQSFTVASSVSGLTPSVSLTATDDATGSAPTWLTLPGSVTAGQSATATASTNGLSTGTYSATVTASATGGYAPATMTVTMVVTDVIETDFSVALLVSDNSGASQTLTFGTAPENASQLNAEAPPAPPSGSFAAFDARFTSDDPLSNGLFQQFFPTTTSSVSWTVQFQPSSDGGAPVELSWDPNAFPAEGRFTLENMPGESGVSVDMRQQSSYTVNLISRTQLQITYALTSVQEMSLARGWNLGALSLEVADASVGAVFTEAAPAAGPFEFDGGYQPAPTLTPGSGFWVLFEDPVTQSVEGFDISQLDLTLEAGWNLIGGLTCDLPLAAVEDPQGILSETLYGFEQAYAPSSVIEANEGYWLLASGGGTVTLACDAATGTTEALATARDEASAPVRLLVRDARGARQTLVLSATKDDAQRYRMPPLPPQGAFDARFAGDTRLMTTDEATVELQARHYPLTLALQGDEAGRMRVEMLSNGRVTSERTLEAGASLEVSDPTVSAVRVYRGADDAPDRFVLHGNAPNPVRLTTALRMDLPSRAEITVEMYDLLGRRVLQGTPQVVEAGHGRRVSVDARSLPAGLYVYRLRATLQDGRTEYHTGRMTVVR